MGMRAKEKVEAILEEIKFLNLTKEFRAAQAVFMAKPFDMTETQSFQEARRLYPGLKASKERQKTARKLREQVKSDPASYKPYAWNVQARRDQLVRNGTEALKNFKQRFSQELESPEQTARREREALIQNELKELASREGPEDVERDLSWAYKSMGHKSLTPLASGAPSCTAYDLYLMARDPENRAKFLDKYLAFKQQKEKLEGGSNLEVEDDRRRTFGVLKKLAAAVVSDIESSLKDMVRQSPNDVVRVLKSIGWTVEPSRV